MIDKPLKIDKIISRGEGEKFERICIWSTSLPLFHKECGLGQNRRVTVSIASIIANSIWFICLEE